MHFHTTIEDCQLELICEVDKKTKEEKKVKFLKSFSRARVLIKTTNIVCGEKYEKMAALGRFTLRYEGKTVAIGKILKYKLGK
jgi:peptide chain release factor subunit 3